MEYKNLNRLYEQAEAVVAAMEHIPGDARERLMDVREQIDELDDGDVAEWVANYYRERYRSSKSADGDAVCLCSNPRCTYKRGKLPYAIRRPASPLSPNEQRIEIRLRNELKRHPEAVVIDNALSKLRQTKREATDELLALLRDCRDYNDEQQAKAETEAEATARDGSSMARRPGSEGETRS